jgi:photosystem II stability/assembly factor-like uncharacterized protein
MAFNVSTNDNKAFSVSAGFQNYTSLISSYNNIGIGKNIATTTNSDQNWILNSPVSSAVYNCMAVTTDGMIQVACTKDKIYRYDNVWTQIYTTSTPGVSFSCVCLSDDGVCITASDLSTGIYVSTNSGTTFTIIPITNPKMVCMSKNGLYQTVINNGNIYTTTDKWATSNGLGVTSPTSLCMSYDGSRQIVFAFVLGRPPVPTLRLSTNYGSTFTTIPQPTLLNPIASCNCSSDGIIVTAVSNEANTNISKVYVSTSPSILFNQVFSTSAQVPTVFSMSLSATGIQQWCVIGGNMYQSTDTGSTWTPVSNLPTQASFWAQACVSGDNSIVTIVGLDTVNTIGYIYYSKTSSSTVSSDKPLLYGLGQSIDYVISLDRMLGL